MTTTDPTADIDVVKEQLRQSGVKYAIASFVDIHGVSKGKFVPIDHLDNMLDGSELFTGAALDGLPQDVSDEELSARPDLSRWFQLPWNKEFAYFPSSLYTAGQPFTASSRDILKRQLGLAADLGYSFNLGVEISPNTLPVCTRFTSSVAVIFPIMTPAIVTFRARISVLTFPVGPTIRASSVLMSP